MGGRYIEVFLAAASPACSGSLSASPVSSPSASVSASPAAAGSQRNLLRAKRRPAAAGAGAAAGGGGEGEPVRRGDGQRLVQAEAGGDGRGVGGWENNHDLSWHLDAPLHRNPRLRRAEVAAQQARGRHPPPPAVARGEAALGPVWRRRACSSV